MPGIPCHLQILELTLEKMAGTTDLSAIRQTMQDNIQWARLGAVGPWLADFIPGTRAQNPYLDIWANLFSLIGDGMLVTKGLLHIVRDVRQFLDTVQPILDDEDLDALKALGQDQLNIVSSVGQDLETLFGQIPFIVLPIGVAGT